MNESDILDECGQDGRINIAVPHININPTHQTGGIPYRL